MKVAIHNGRIPATTFIERLIEGLADAGVEVWLFGEIVGPVSYDSPNVRVCGWRGEFGRKLFLLRFLIQFFFVNPKELLKLWSIVQENNLKIKLYLLSKYLPVLWYKPDVFHLQWVKGVGEWQWVQAFDIKLVVSLRGAQINYEPIANPKVAELYLRFFPFVDGFHAVSSAIAKEALKYGAASGKLCVVYSGLNLNHYRFEPNIYQSSGPLKIISIGRPHWKKGFHYAIDAMATLKGKIDFHYTIVGGSAEEYIFQVHQLELENDVLLLKKMPHEKVIQLLKSSHLLLLPSVEEGIANVVLEAMALGVPVISTDCGGMAEVIRDGSNGFLVPVRSPSAMAEVVLKFSLLNCTERNRIAHEARRTIELKHSEENMVKGMIELYEKVMRHDSIKDDKIKLNN